MAALPLLLPPARPDGGLPPLDLPQPLTPERLKHAYRRAGGNITQAARLLGVHKVTLYRHMKALGITRADLAGQPPDSVEPAVAGDAGE